MPNRNALVKQARLDERAQQIKLQQDRELRTRNIVIATFVALVLGGSATLWVLASGVLNPPTKISANAADKSFAVADEGFTHVTEGSSIAYKHSPPSSGNHYPTPAAWGPSQTILAPGTWIHNLEHGGIALVYTCSTDCTDIASAARLLYQSLPQHNEPFHASPGVSTIQETKFVSSQFVGTMPQKFAVLAWDRELDLATLDTGAVTNFYNKYSEHGREDLP